MSLPVACCDGRAGLQSQMRCPVNKNQTHRIARALVIIGATAIMTPRASAGTDAERRKPEVVATYGKLPIGFEANGGQTDRNVKFLSRGRGYTLFLTGDGAALSLRRGASTAAVRTRLLGANPKSAVSGAGRLPGTSNYFIGNDPAKWRTGIPSYSKVRYASVYPGVDLVYYGNQGKLEYDFIVAPAADPGRIAMEVDGRLKVDARGDLVVGTNAGDVSFQRPVAYQVTRAKGKQPVAAEYALTGTNRVGFRLAAYDRSTPLIIDPVLSYSTYFGGSGFEAQFGMAVDSAGNAYLTGETNSVNYPTASAEQAANAGG